MNLKQHWNNWGFYLDDEKFDEVYDAFDYDKDGLIDYTDFKKTIGEKIQPEEYLYFRQDNPSTMNLNPNEYKSCWEELPKVKSNAKPFHIKIGVEKATAIIRRLKKDIGAEKWTAIIKELCENPPWIWDTFEDLLKYHNRTLIRKESEILKSIISENTTNGVILAVEKLKYLNEAATVNNEELLLEDEDVEEFRDNCTIYGFLSKSRDEKITENISEDQFIKIIITKDLREVIKTIKSIDVDKNGYVTFLELTNCFKNHFENELYGKSLVKILKPFWAIQNKILINYNQFLDHIKEKIKSYHKGSIESLYCSYEIFN